MIQKQPIRNVFQEPEIAATYDNFYQEKLGEKIDEIEKELLGQHLNEIKIKELLELGCGTGHWTRFFCEKGFRVTGIDESKSMLKIAEKNKPKNCEFRKADATQLPFQDNSFSAIASVTMLEFVEDVTKVMNEIDRILKPGGTLILGCLNENSELGKSKEYDPVFQHARFFTPEKIQTILERFGEPNLSFGVYLSPGFEILDGTEEQGHTTPVFIAATVKENKK